MNRQSRSRVCFLGIFIVAIFASIQLGAEPPKATYASDGDAAPPGWQPASPRDEIRPRFSFDVKGGPKGEGSLLITADEREGLHGWWQKSFPVTGGRYYRFQALRKVHDLNQPRRSAVVRILWQDDRGKSVPMDEPAAKGSIELGAGTRPHGLRALPDGHLLVTAEGTKELLIVDPGGLRRVDGHAGVIARIPTDQQTSHMVVASPDGTRAYVANIGSGSVTAVDLATRKVLRDVPTGKGAEGIDISPSGSEVWVTNRGNDTVSVIDARSLEITATLKAAEFPIRIKFTPDGKRALVSCARSGDVRVFDVAGRKELLRIRLGLQQRSRAWT